MKKKTQLVSVALDESCHELVKRTAARCGLSITTLLNIAAEAFINSLLKQQVKPPAREGRKPPAGKAVEKRAVLKRELYETMSDYGVFLDVPLSNMLRDAILGQRFNYQRLQPVNARSLGSVRKTLFYLEQNAPTPV